jgi:hypothetical protein
MCIIAIFKGDKVPSYVRNGIRAGRQHIKCQGDMTVSRRHRNQR